jgi:ATPase subunit of ABC transporter with duplicated ATPase domains
VILVIALQARNLNKFYGDNHILKSVNLLINEKERVGLVGANGSGKTTLLNCISGQIEFDSGQVIKGNALSLAYLEQMPPFDSNPPSPLTLTYVPDVVIALVPL